MTGSSGGTPPWTRFSHDPRRHPELRASDGDREVAWALISQAYADGRLGPAEHDERSDRLWRTVRLGQLLRLLEDLVPTGEPADEPKPGPVGDQAAGVALWRQVLALVVPSLVCVALWLWASPHFFWPLWVIVYTGAPVARILLERLRRARVP